MDRRSPGSDRGQFSGGLVPTSRHGGWNQEESAARRFLDAGAFVATNPTDDSITVDLPGLNAPGVRFVIASFPLTDGARPSRDVKTIVAWSVDG